MWTWAASMSGTCLCPLTSWWKTFMTSPMFHLHTMELPAAGMLSYLGLPQMLKRSILSVQMTLTLKCFIRMAEIHLNWMQLRLEWLKDVSGHHSALVVSMPTVPNRKTHCQGLRDASNSFSAQETRAVHSTASGTDRHACAMHFI